MVLAALLSDKWCLLTLLYLLNRCEQKLTYELIEGDPARLGKRG